MPRYLVDNYPKTVSGLLAWYRADRSVTIDSSGNVSQWSDLGPTGYHLTQATAGNRPAFNNSAVNGGPCVDWAAGAVSRGLSTAATFPLGAFTLIGVIRPTAVSGYVVVHHQDTSNGMYVYGQSGASVEVDRSSSKDQGNIAATWLSDGVLRSFAAAYNGTSASQVAFRNGVQDTITVTAANNVGTSLVTDVLYVGMNQAGAGPYRGQMQELIFYNRALSTSEIIAFEPYLRGSWRTY